MKRLLRFLLAAWCVAGLSAPTGAMGRHDEPPKPDAPSEPRPGSPADPRDWDRVNALTRQGAYREALALLDRLAAAAPDDPRLHLYRALCQARIESPPPFPTVPRDELASLTRRLEQEERAQRRDQAQRKALERAVKQEQDRWDKELETLAREAKQAAARRQQAQEAEERVRAQAERDRTRQLAQRPAPTPAPEQPSAPTAPPQPSAPPREARPGEAVPPLGPPRRGIELAPVVVPTAPPAGAVQINADQMHVSPDRKVAVAEGNVEVVFENAVLTSDRLTLFTDTKDVYAEGRVRLEDGGQVYRGEMVHYNLETKKGRFLQGTVASPPWYEHGRSVEHLAEGIFEVTPGYLTSCDHDPPHFKFYGNRAIVFAEDRLARVRHATFTVEQLPLIYLPWISVADRQTPFFFIPGKRKPWEQFVLMGYRYEWPEGHNGTIHLDWRRAFGWGVGADHKFETKELGKGLLRLYYNDERYLRVPEDALVKGASDRRYRILWRHLWQPTEDTTVVTDLQKFSDQDFRKDLLFREEFTEDDVPQSFVSVVKSAPAISVTGLVRQRMNRFETVDEVEPQLIVETRETPILEESPLYTQSRLDFANFQTKRKRSDNDTDAVRLDWFQQLRYALNLFRPILVTPRVGVRQTYYTKDIQSGAEATPATDRYQGKRDLLSGQFSMGADASLKLFRLFPVAMTNVLGLNLNRLRHVLTPTLAYSYVHQPTVPNSLLTFAAAEGSTNTLSFGVENKLQTKRVAGGAKPRSVDLARFLLSLPYTFQGNANKQGGRVGDWSFDLELYPWPWLRLETDWVIPSHFVKGTRDDRIRVWNLDLVMVGGPDATKTQTVAGDVEAPVRRAFIPGPKGGIERFLPTGQWYLGLGHRYSQNDKTESVLQFDWGLSEKWEIGTFHRFTWKELAGGLKRFHNVREYQYSLRRDLHDWVAELMYRVDREFGEELFFTVTLKAYPEFPIEFGESYHEPKLGSQSSPFSPVGR